MIDYDRHDSDAELSSSNESAEFFSVGEFLAILKNDDPDACFNAVENAVKYYRKSGDSIFVRDIFFHLLGDGDELIRCAALEFFEDHHTLVTSSKIVPLLMDVDPIVRGAGCVGSW